MLTHYDVEQFTGAERDVLRRYVTNLQGPVFALVNLPEVVKGALFARYSRTHKSLRRLLLDEFIGDLDVSGDSTIDATVGLARADELYQRVFVEYGDDSVAQLGSVHLACEQVSNVLTKVLERPRLMSYLEQSTRYMDYDKRRLGRFRYLRPAEVMNSDAAMRYVAGLDRVFEAYGELRDRMRPYYQELMRPTGVVTDIAHAQAVRAKTLDAARGMLPAATLSNVGIFGSGQAYEALLMRLAVSPLPEARTYGEMMLAELRKVIPSFLKRVDQPERGVAWSRYLQQTAEGVEELAADLFDDAEPEPAPRVSLTDFDPEGEVKLLAAMLYPATNLPERQVMARVETMSGAERDELVRRFVGERGNRRHRPGRALERIDYRFDVLGDYGGFRDLQRHRLLTIDWQPLGTKHGYEVPAYVREAGAAQLFDDTMGRSAALHADLVEHVGERIAAYAVCFAYRIRYVMQMNAREAMHIIELRTQPQGHDEYRQICLEMAEQIEQVTGHRAVARMLTYAVRDEAPSGRLAAEVATAKRREAAAPSSAVTAESGGDA